MISSRFLKQSLKLNQDLSNESNHLCVATLDLELYVRIPSLAIFDKNGLNFFLNLVNCLGLKSECGNKDTA